MRFLRLAEKSAVKFLKPAVYKKKYGLGILPQRSPLKIEKSK